MIFWQAFLLTCGALLGLAVAIAAFVGFLVIVHVGKEAYDERSRRIWKNDPLPDSSDRGWARHPKPPTDF